MSYSAQEYFLEKEDKENVQDTTNRSGSSDGQAKELLDAVKGRMGVVPNNTGAMASSPATLEAYLSLSGALAKSKFDLQLREVGVEVGHAWINRFRRLLIRWEKKAGNYLSLLYFACAIIC